MGRSLSLFSFNLLEISSDFMFVRAQVAEFKDSSKPLPAEQYEFDFQFWIGFERTRKSSILKVILRKSSGRDSTTLFVQFVFVISNLSNSIQFYCDYSSLFHCDNKQ